MRAALQNADPPPYVPGMEAAGIVDEGGSDVPARLKLGDAVMAIVLPKAVTARIASKSCSTPGLSSAPRPERAKLRPAAWR